VLAILVVAALYGGVFVLHLRADSNPGCEPPGSTSTCTRIFFMGNSYTSVNDLPTIFGDLAWSGGHRVETATSAPGGWTLLDHATSQDDRDMLASRKWDLVVVQEQSEIPSLESMRQAQMYPAARELVTMIRGAGAQPMFFLTWAHQNGWPVYGMSDYASMQSAIDDGYLFIAGEQHAAVAPVGYAWSAVVGQETNPGLWQDDGSHPTTRGTYLAACVFYATIFLQSPVGLKYHAGLSDNEAALSQAAAAATVLGDPAKWGAR
jgi:hypothetical protein